MNKSTMNNSFKIKPILIALFVVLIAVVAYGAHIYFAPKSNFPPNTTIVPAKGKYAYENTTNDFQTKFKAKPTDPDSIKFSNSIGNISFFTPSEQSFGSLNTNSPPTTDGNTITYPEIFTKMDLRYTISSSRLLEEFIINDKDTALKINRIDQRAKTSNRYEIEQNGNITFYNDEQISFTLPNPVMYELNDRGVFSYGIHYEITRDGNNLSISKVIDQDGMAWLAHGNRRYPIAIDLVIDSAEALASGAGVSIDNGDTVANWASSDDTNSAISQEVSIKQEGTGSVKVTTVADAAGINLDLMEYSNDSTAQSTYVTTGQTATGGTITTSGYDNIHTFTSSGTFTPTASGNVDRLIVGGGGGGGGVAPNGWSGGGGGAGGMLTGTTAVTAQAYTVTVGLGGNGGGDSSMGTSGNSSSFAGLTAIGGGGGAGAIRGGAPVGLGGGSGGGGTNGSAGGAGTGGQGNNGTAGLTSGSYMGGSGGGAGGTGVSGSSRGPGVSSSISGSAITYAVGGYSNPWIDAVTNGAAGTANRGNGGDGAAPSTGTGATGGAGGSGIVIIRYPTQLQSYTENTIKTEGTYSLKGYAEITTGLNKTLTRTIGAPLNLSNHTTVSFDIRASRTGSNIKVGLHDVGGVTTEVTPNITGANAFQAASIDLSGVSNANKDAIDKIIVTIVNADAANTFYIDNMKTGLTVASNGDTITRTVQAADLSAITSLTYWVRSSTTGTFATFGFGEASATEQTNTITINQANTWEQKTWDVTGIAAASRNAVTKYAFTFTANTNGALFYFDDIQSLDISSTWISSNTNHTNVSLEQTIKIEGSGSIKTTTTANSVSTVDLMEYATGTAARTAYVAVSSNNVLATGGTITLVGGNRIHTFTSSGTFTVPDGTATAQALVVAGGGGAGTNGGGGGGAGGLLYNASIGITAQAYTVTVGPGGGTSTNGSNSVFSTMNAIGGGGGGSRDSDFAGHAGGSGGGGGGAGSATTGGAPTASQGYIGGAGFGGGGGAGPGGGGGCGAAGQAGANQKGGNGGIGCANSITGASVYYAGGGGGGLVGSFAGTPGVGGNGGGGSGVTPGGLGSNGTANRGGGGGGNNASGGSGIVIISYPAVDIQAYSEPTIKTEGTYSLKGYAEITSSANKTLTRTIGSPLNLSNAYSVTFDIRSTRTGSNIKVGLRDAGGVITEVTPNITGANAFQSATIDLSGVTNANKDAIDKIIITIVDAAAANTFYIDNMKSNIGSQNSTLNKTTSTTDLSSASNLTFWVHSTVAGSFVRFQFGESASTEQTKTITIAQANTWEQVVWDISAIAGTARNAVTRYAFQFIGDTGGADFYFDDIQTNSIAAPTLGTATGLSTSSIRWNFTDTSTDETGFKVYDSNSSLLVTCASANIASCDETGLSTNTQYTRKIGAYSAVATTISAGTTSRYTLADTPNTPVVNTRTSSTVLVNPDPGTNPSGTLMAIYRESGIICDGSGGVYLAANGSSNGATAIWQDDATWGSVTATGLTTETQYSFCVKAKNGDGIETGWSGLSGDNGGYVPLGGGYINTSNTTAINKYIDGYDPARYVIGIDDGSGTTNTANFELRSGIFTLNSNETLVTGSMTLTGGTMAIASGSVIKLNTPVWAVDADVDGYTADNKLYYGAAPGGGRRKYLLTTLSSADCADNSYNASNTCCIVATRYQDADGDTYGNPSVSIQSCPVGGYVDNNTDCYDSNANAKPGSTYCSSTNRGDGSYDYNCSTTSTKCSTNYTYGTGTINRNYTDVCGSCGNCNRRCCGGSNLIYSVATINCGQTGGTCTDLTGCQGGSCSRSVGQMCGSNPACEDYSGSGPTCNLCKTISSGTQACQ